MKNPAKKKNTGLTDDQKDRLEEMAGLISAGKFEPGSMEGYAASMRESLGRSRELALALVERLGSIKNRAAAGVLREMADLFSDKKYVKAVRRAEYRLRSAGLMEEEEEKPEGPEPRVLVRSREPLGPLAYASKMDSSGTEALMVVLPSGGSHGIALFAIDARKGVKNLERAEASAGEAERVLNNFRREKGLEVREIPLGHAARVIEYAVDVTRKEGRAPARGAVEVLDKLKEQLREPRESSIERLLDESGEDVRDLLKGSEELAGWEQFNTYLFPQELIAPVAERLKGLEDSSIVLLGESQKRIGRELTDEAMDAVFTEGVKRDLVFRLEETAFHLYLGGKREECLLALAAARDIAEGPSVLNLFARALLERSLSALGVKLDEGVAERGQGLIKMP